MMWENYFICKSERKRTHEKPRRRGESDVKMDIIEI
jgi:hypothetical protein